MIAFLTVYILVYGGINAYWVWKVCRAWRGQPVLAGLLITWGLCMVLAPILGRVLERMEWAWASSVVAQIGYVWMAWAFWFFAFGLVLDIWQGVAWLSGVPGLSPRLTVMVVSVSLIILTCWGMLEARQITVESLRFHAPVKQPITVAQVSDLHLGPHLARAQWQQVVRELERVNPDLIVSTGDFMDTSLDVMGDALDAFADLKAPLGKLAVTGNHEYYPGLERTLAFHRRAGFTMLRGETRLYPGLAVSGVDDPAGKFTGDECVVDERVLEDQPGRFHVLLKHQPIPDPESVGRFQLQLSGHTHGGQIFPFGLLTALSYGRTSGLHTLRQGMRLYISRGSGTWGPPFRVLAPPEITLIHLIPESQGELVAAVQDCGSQIHAATE